MPIRFRCQDCQSRVKVPEGSQGKQVKCPRCGRIQAVPRHQSQMEDSDAGNLEVHTCVGSMHRAPKRKEALVGTGVSSDRHEYSGGGAPAGGGLDIPDQPSNGSDHGKQSPRLSRKERRRRAALAREAQREREEMAAREEAAQDQDAIAESRKRVEDLFATSHKKDFTEEEASVEQVAPVEAALTTQVKAPESITLRGANKIEASEPEVVETAGQVAEPRAQQGEKESLKPEAWSFDLTSEAYPFLRIIPWVLRITALMLIGPAFKIMLVADASGFSGVVCMLILFAGLAMVVVTWTVGEIATAVRDIALKKATG